MSYYKGDSIVTNIYIHKTYKSLSSKYAMDVNACNICDCLSKNSLYSDLYYQLCYINALLKFLGNPYRVRSAITFIITIEPDTRMAKNRKVFKRFFSALSVLDKTKNT